MILWLKRTTARILRAYWEKLTGLQEKSSPHVKVMQRLLFHYYQNLSATPKSLPKLSDTGFRVYSQFEEDGLLLFLFAVLGAKNKTFVDIGAGNGILSNCANFAVNFGWHGLFIDSDPERVRRGVDFYKHHPDTSLYPPVFLRSKVTRDNVNEIIQKAGFQGEVDLLSIDIDGNDYWIWDALECIQPRVVIIETHVEFGYQSIVVPYDENYFYPGDHPDYNGASPAAMVKLAHRKGYRLVGANSYGFNAIFIKRGIGEDLIPEISIESILQHPRNKERFKVFENVKDKTFLEV